MIGSFPTLYPEELVYSACARFSERVAYPTKRAVVVELFSAENVKARVYLPCNLGSLVAGLQPGHKYTVDHLIDNHTLLPYYSRFIPPARLEALRLDMANGSGQRIHTRAGIKASRVPYPEKLRFCSACATHDRHRYGETYWHRVHQVPGVLLCPTHNMVLQDSSVYTQPHSRFDFISAESAVPAGSEESTGTVSAGDEAHCDKFARIARDAAWLLTHPVSIMTPHDIQALYIGELVRQGLALETGRVRSAELIQAFLDYYSTKLLETLGCPIDKNGGRNWLAPLLRADARDMMQHPLYHLLLVQFLGYSAEEFYTSRSAPSCVLPTEPQGTKVTPHGSGDRGEGSEKRAIWQALMSAYPGEGVTTLRRYNKSLYMWLYRSDGEWLSANKPPSRHGSNRPAHRPAIVDWCERDDTLASAVQDAANRIKASRGRPTRVTVASICRKVGVGYTPLLRDHLGKLPNTEIALRKVTESVHEHALRRISWAVAQYLDEGVVPMEWELVQRAGVYKVKTNTDVKTAIEVGLDRLSSLRA